jgi:catechol 2,3-dioxygenase-like lactoylglutathione lyase family enzyme
VRRGLSTINLWADDLPAATRWYTDLLGVEPYFSYLDMLGNRRGA